MFGEAMVSSVTGNKPTYTNKKIEVGVVDNGDRPGIISVVDLQNIHNDHVSVSMLLISFQLDGCLLPFVDWKPLNGYLANSEDPDEMPLNAAFHQGLHCLLSQNSSSEKEIQYF